MAPHRTQARAQRGFTLIEMAIAVAIFGTLASGAIMATSAWLGKQAVDKTHKNLDRIESAITLFVVQNGRLPCPYNPNAAAGTSFNCSSGDDAYFGLVPYRELGLQRTDVTDGWNRYITYVADGTKANGTPFGTPLAKLSEFTGSDAEIEVLDGAGVGCKTMSPSDPTVCAAYVLISHGEPGRGAFVNFSAAGATRVPDHPDNGAAAGEILNTHPVGGLSSPQFAAEFQGTANENWDHIVRFRTPAQVLRDAW